MEKAIYFKWTTCPDCRQTDQWLRELKAEKTEYKNIPFTTVDETARKANLPDYPHEHVPCIYWNKKKLYEGEQTKEQLRAALDYILTEEGKTGSD